MDSEKLLTDIHTNLASDPIASEHLGDNSDPRWQTNSDGLLLHNQQTYIPNISDLRLHVLQYKHNRILSGHFGIKILRMIQQDFTWPGIRAFVKDYCKACRK